MFSAIEKYNFYQKSPRGGTPAYATPSRLIRSSGPGAPLYPSNTSECIGVWRASSSTPFCSFGNPQWEHPGDGARPIRWKNRFRSPCPVAVRRRTILSDYLAPQRARKCAPYKVFEHEAQILQVPHRAGSSATSSGHGYWTLWLTSFGQPVEAPDPRCP